MSIQKISEENKASQAGIQKLPAEAEKRNKSLHDENKKIYGAMQEQSKQSKQMLAAEKQISESVEVMRANIESSLEANNSRVSECEAKISGLEEKVVQHASTVNELVAEQDLRIQELQHQMSRLQNTSSPLNCTTYVYKTLDDGNSQLKFFGHENENPVNCLLYTSRCV